MKNFPKQYHALTTVVRFLPRPKFQMFSTESVMMVKVVSYLAKLEAAVHRCLQPFIEKRLFMNVFFNKVAGLQFRKRLSKDVSCKFASYFRTLFLQNTFGW